MTYWKIDPGKVQTVLTGVKPNVEALSKLLTAEALEAIPAKLEPGAPLTAMAPAAMQALLADQADEIKSIGSCVGAGINGVYNATIAYANGNEAMAGNFQREMVKSAKSGDFSYFEKHGYNN